MIFVLVLKKNRLCLLYTKKKNKKTKNKRPLYQLPFNPINMCVFLFKKKKKQNDRHQQKKKKKKNIKIYRMLFFFFHSSFLFSFLL